jgi:drug/metabolite transporter (DMT)-like permease
MEEGDEIATSRHTLAVGRNSARGLLYIGAATFCWGLSATLGRAAFTGQLLSGSDVRGVNPLILSQCRTSFSCIAVGVGLLIKRGPKRLQIAGSGLLQLLLLGLGGVAVSNYFYYLAIQRTNVATAIILQYTAPVWVLLYMVLRGRERLTAPKMASVLLAISGIALVIGLIGHSRLHLDSIGIAAALLASFSFTYYNIGGHYVLESYDRWIVLLYTTLAASLFWCVVNPPTKIIAAHYSATTWLFLAGFSFLSVLIPFSFYFAGLENLVPTKAIIASCLEPVFSILIAAIALHEFVGAWQAVGIAMVLTAIILAQRPASDTHAIAGPVD